MKTWFTILNVADDTAEVRIYDDIGSYGVSAKAFCEQFAGIKAAKIDLRINSYGGEVFDAAAICTAIKEHSADVTAHVDGIAASAASVIAAACDRVEIGKSAFMMIHNAMSGQYGYASDLRKTADMLDKLSGSIAQVYSDKTGKPADVVRKAMDDETWFDASEAKAWGLADSIKNDDEDEDDEDDEFENAKNFPAINSIAPLLVQRFKNVPDRIRRLAVNRAKHREANAMLNIITRDGKNFVTIDGKEHEVTVATPAPKTTETQPANQAGKIEQLGGKTEQEVLAAVNKAKEDAVKEERAYREMFETTLNSAGLTGKAAEDFKKFYGRPEADLKFLASNAIGNRAKPVGEGSGEPEKKAEEDKAKKEIRDYCEKRFANEARIRKQYRVGTNNAEDAGYKAGLEKFIAIETKCRQDEAKKTTNQAEEPSGDDPISKLLKNKSVYG